MRPNAVRRLLGTERDAYTQVGGVWKGFMKEVAFELLSGIGAERSRGEAEGEFWQPGREVRRVASGTLKDRRIASHPHPEVSEQQ